MSGVHDWVCVRAYVCVCVCVRACVRACVCVHTFGLHGLLKGLLVIRVSDVVESLTNHVQLQTSGYNSSELAAGVCYIHIHMCVHVSWVHECIELHSSDQINMPAMS